MPSMMPTTTDAKMGREYWRSLDDFAQSPQFVELVQREFPSLLDDVVTPANRRSFLKLMGASLALAGVGLAGCRRWPDEKIAPFAHRPEGYVPGEPAYFATSMDLGGVGCGLIATSFDGRPIKVEGNERHPINGGSVTISGKTFSVGSCDVFAQSGILEFYDPERSRDVVRRTLEGDRPSARAAGLDEFLSWAKAHFASLKANQGAGLAILSQADSSPSLHDMKARVAAAFPKAVWHEYESISRDNEIEGARLALGNAYRAHYALDKADVVACLDSDLLVAHPASAKHARDFASRRRSIDKTMSRLYAAEGVLSLTGANADHRLAIKSRDVASLTSMLIAALAREGVTVLGGEAIGSVKPVPGEQVAAWVNAVARDLAAAMRAGGFSLVVPGPRQPAAVHAACHAINFALQNVGRTVHFTAEPEGARQSHIASLRALTEACTAGSVQTLLILGGNPAYDAPIDLGFGEAMLNVATCIHLSLYDNETSQRCDWHVNAAHTLESWGDTRAWDGTVAPVQPIIEPLYDGLTPAEMLAVVLDDEVKDGYSIARRWFSSLHGEGMGFEAAWRNYLHDGVLPGSAWKREDVRLSTRDWPAALSRLADAGATQEGDEVVFTPDPAIYDGRFANNGWLQELPDPIGKISWDNAAFMSPAMAERLGARGNDLVVIDSPTGGNPLEIAVHIIPGMADGVVNIHLGYGRTAAGHIGTGVGRNAGLLRGSQGMGFAVAHVEKGRGTYELATVQDHHAMDSKVTRQGVQDRLPMLVRQARLDRYEQVGKDAFFDEKHVHLPPIVSLWDEYNYEASGAHRWAMAIDLQTCIGCSACMIACQAENNVPIVGKDQVLFGREMHWIRVDRYYKGRDVHNPEVVFQPVTCQHCENAPCEQVCPVAATTHDKEGLNVMVYNRCVGTRYCSNNCPYKVRRFNFYDWHVEDPRAEGLRPPRVDIPDVVHDKAFRGGSEVKRMAFNPDVTVRPRGVMEKCSFCVQRINRVKIEAKNAWVKAGGTGSGSSRYEIADGAVTPACAQACPTQAIVFGDLRDPGSRVSALFRDPRQYSLLEELNTKPRTRFLGKVRNYNASLKPIPAHGDAEAAGH
ncbi:MAG: TAT-variant-translocated molybdopterin oxidoreductase [Phycisphaeraceae bacterium]|nr:MAG: TAT-variant-translocated molybdopterin oxidoreductase [Phycisphaeraceae bacterium]